MARGTREHEVHLAKLANLTIAWAEKSFDKLTTEQKLKVLCALAPKYVPQKIEAEVKSEGITVILSDGRKVTA